MSKHSESQNKVIAAATSLSLLHAECKKFKHYMTLSLDSESDDAPCILRALVFKLRELTSIAIALGQPLLKFQNL